VDRVPNGGLVNYVSNGNLVDCAPEGKLLGQMSEAKLADHTLEGDLVGHPFEGALVSHVPEAQLVNRAPVAVRRGYLGVESGRPPSTGMVAPVVGVWRVAKKSTALATCVAVTLALSRFRSL